MSNDPLPIKSCEGFCFFFQKEPSSMLLRTLAQVLFLKSTISMVSRSVDRSLQTNYVDRRTPPHLTFSVKNFSQMQKSIHSMLFVLSVACVQYDYIPMRSLFHFFEGTTLGNGTDVQCNVHWIQLHIHIEHGWVFAHDRN